MAAILECVPNFSEGRNIAAIDFITDAIIKAEDVQLLHIDRGESANRTVITFAGAPDAVIEAAFRGAEAASEVIDMRRHKGTHPRIGATDVLPLVPVSGIPLAMAAVMARNLARRIAEELNIPAYCYEAAAFTPQRRSLAYCRKGEYEGLAAKIASEEGRPDFGETEFTERAARSGATVVGARDLLLAVNFNLNTGSVEAAGEIAGRVRESGRNGIPGTLKGCRAIGWYIEEYGRAQVSMNITDLAKTALYEAFEEVSRMAEEAGLRVTGTEIIGLAPLEALTRAGRHFLSKEVSEREAIEAAIDKMRLNELTPFDPQSRIIEYLLKRQRYD